MQPKRNDRPQSIAEFLQLLEEAETEPETPKKRGWLYVAIACVVAAVVLVGGLSVELAAQYKATGNVNGHEYVDLGLSVKWATCNVGATTPEVYGNYYAWGETASKTNYDWSTYKHCNGSYDTMTKYCTKSRYGYNGFTDEKTTLDLSDDAARANWGGSWRMPTRAEIVELRDNCTWTWTKKNGIKGYKVTSKTNGNSIFLPAAGRRNGTSVNYVGFYGRYWSSSLRGSDPIDAYYLYFSSRDVAWRCDYRYYGHTVRAVCP